jgi:hypothetical protein
MPSLTADLREAYRRSSGGLPEKSRLSRVRARATYTDGGERSRRLMVVVLAYRSGPRQRWAPILLDLLAPALLASLRRLRPEPPVLTEEDIRQQLVVEVLQAAATMPLPAKLSYLRRRLVARANQGVRRWLERERRRQGRQEPLEEMGKGER